MGVMENKTTFLVKFKDCHLINVYANWIDNFQVIYCTIFAISELKIRLEQIINWKINPVWNFYAGLTPDKYALIFIFNSESLIIMDLQLTIVISNIWKIFQMQCQYYYYIYHKVICYNKIFGPKKDSQIFFVLYPEWEISTRAGHYVQFYSK